MMERGEHKVKVNEILTCSSLQCARPFILQLPQEVWTVLMKFRPEEPRCLTEQQLSYSQRLKLSGVHSHQQSQKKTEGG